MRVIRGLLLSRYQRSNCTIPQGALGRRLYLRDSSQVCLQAWPATTTVTLSRNTTHPGYTLGRLLV